MSLSFSGLPAVRNITYGSLASCPSTLRAIANLAARVGGTSSITSAAPLKSGSGPVAQSD